MGIEKEVEIWYAMRATYRREPDAMYLLKKENLGCFIPMQYKISIKKGKKVRALVPVVHNLLFVHARPSDVQRVKSQVTYLQYITDTRSGQKIIVPDSQMQRFIAVSGTYDDHLLYFQPDELNLSKGTKVRITGGEFEALGYSRTGKAIVEGFITGREFSVETYTQNNKTTVVTITEKLCIGEAEGFFVEDTHIEPARITKQEWELVSETVSKALCLIGLNNCPSHTEIKLNESGAYIIEIACRLGGDYITSDLVPLSTGIDMLRNLVNCSLGLPVDVLRKHEKCSAVQFLNPLNYQRCVDFLSSSRSSAVFRSEIRPYSEKKIKNSLDRLGYIILQTDSMEELESILRTIK